MHEQEELSRAGWRVERGHPSANWGVWRRQKRDTRQEGSEGCGVRQVEREVAGRVEHTSGRGALERALERQVRQRRGQPLKRQARQMRERPQGCWTVEGESGQDKQQAC